MFGTYSTTKDIYTNPLFPRTSAYLDAMLVSRRACMGLLHDNLVSVWHGSPYPVSVPAACALAFYLDLSDQGKHLVLTPRPNQPGYLDCVLSPNSD